MTIQQTSVGAPALGQNGTFYSIVDREILSKRASGAVPVGYVVVPGAAAGDAKVPDVVPAADVDAIMASNATLGAAAGTDYTGADFDGALGANLNPARRVTFTLASEIDWDATTAVVYGQDASGQHIVEEFSIPDNGNATVTGKKFFSKINRVTIPAQTGDAVGSIGVTADVGALRATGIALLDVGQSYDGATESDLDYADNDMMKVAARGEVIVTVNDVAAVAGETPFVRLIAGASEVVGEIVGGPDGSAGAEDCAPLVGARFVTSGSAGDLVVVKLG